jgi:hypothetical protein
MPASRIDASSVLSAVVVEADQTRYQIPSRMVRLRRNGVEFRSPAPFALWTEMTVSLDGPAAGGAQPLTGVVVSCEGNRHWGFAVVVLFLDGALEAEPPRKLPEDRWAS